MTARIEHASQRTDRVRNALRFRQELFGLGEWDENQLRRSLAAGEVLRVARGVYIGASEWRRFTPEDRLLAATLAQARINEARGWIFTHESAAALWQLPLWNLRSSRVHVATTSQAPARSSPRVMRRICSLGDEDVAERFGVRCTSLSRTLVDLARSPNPELAIGAVDAGLRRLLPGSRGGLPEGVELWREEMLGALAKVTGRGVRSAVHVITLADPRADSVAESVSRLYLARLGLDVEIQVPIAFDGRPRYWVDFEFRGQNVLGEIDGRIKYLDAGIRGDATAEQVVLAEKAREDEIRGVTGKRIVRWQVEHLRSARALGERLQRFGIAVPALQG